MTAEVWIVANSHAGGGRAARHARAALRALNDAGFACRLVLPASAEDSTRMAAQAVAAGARAVIACGGDGTVHTVLQALVGADVPLGILAGGSGDDIAASLGMSTGDPAATSAWLVEALAGGRTRAVDVGTAMTADGLSRYFLSVLCTGFDASVNERANTLTRLGRQRYNVALVRELASFKPLKYRVRIDDAETVLDAMLLSIGNGPQFGGGMRICPDASMDDGMLDVIVLAAVTRVTLLRVFPTVYRGTHVHHPAVSTFRARTVHVEAPGQVAYADGERIGPLPVEVTVRPGALPVLTT